MSEAKMTEKAKFEIEGGREVLLEKTETGKVDIESNSVPKKVNPPLSPGRTVALIVVVTFTMAMNAGGMQGLNIALPIIQADLNMRESDLQWISSAYSLTSGCFLLLSGRFADAYGRRICFLIGLSWYSIWTLIGSFMNSSVALIVCRSLAGMGASMGIPSSIGIIASNVHGPMKATAFAMFAAGAPVGGGTGTVLGGVLTAYSKETWRAVLWVFSGLSAVIVIVGYFLVPHDSKTKKDSRIDYLGAVLVTSGLILLQFTVSDGVNAPRGWATPYIFVLFIASIICLTSFFLWQYHLAKMGERPPLMRLALFTRAKGKLAAVYCIGFVAWMGFISISYHATLFYQQVQMTGTIGAVLRFLPCSISGLICNFIVAKIIHQVPTQYIVCAGLLATGVANLFMALSWRTIIYWSLPFNAMWMCVVGADFLMATGSTFVSSLALPEEQSVAGALYQTMTQLGGSFGLALTSALATSVQNTALTQGVDSIDALLQGLHSAFWLGCGFSFSALILAMITLRGLGIITSHGHGHAPTPVLKVEDPMPVEKV